MTLKITDHPGTEPEAFTKFQYLIKQYMVTNCVRRIDKLRIMMLLTLAKVIEYWAKKWFQKKLISKVKTGS